MNAVQTVKSCFKIKTIQNNKKQPNNSFLHVKFFDAIKFIFLSSVLLEKCVYSRKPKIKGQERSSVVVPCSSLLGLDEVGEMSPDRGAPLPRKQGFKRYNEALKRVRPVRFKKA